MSRFPFFLFSFAVSFLLCPAVRLLAIRLGAVDRPGGRHIHTAPTPRLGGLAVACAIGCALFLEGNDLGDTSLLWALATGGGVMLLMGVRDDTRGLSPLFKMALQLIGALLAVFFGVRLEGIGVWAVPATLLCLLLLTNAYNLVDGLDGLCAGCSGIGGGAFALLGLASGDPTITALGLSVLGGCLGFLPYNFRRPKLFLGDTGAQLIGFCLGLMTVRSINAGRTVTALCIVAYPLAEILATVLRRLRRGQSPLAADRGHFHYRLIDRGLSHGRATVLLLLPSLFLSMVGLLLPLATPASEAVLLLSIPGITLCWRIEGKTRPKGKVLFERSPHNSQP